MWSKRSAQCEAAQIDDALARARNGEPAEQIARDAPASADLLPVVRMIESLAPTPAPRLAEGRRRFLNAAHRSAPSRSSGTAYRAPLVIATACVCALIVGATLVMLGQPTPAPTTSPTFTITPVKTALAPRNAVRAHLVPSPLPEILSPKPQPVPTPLPMIYD